VSGTLNGAFARKATKESDWERARQFAATYVINNSWNTAPAPIPLPPAETTSGQQETAGISIADAIKAYIHEHESSNSAFNTICQVRSELGQFQRYSDVLGLRYLDEWTTPLIRQMRDTWKVSPRTRARKLNALKPFFEFFIESQDIDVNPARIRTRRNRAAKTGENITSAQKNPFLDEELKRMLAGCDNYNRTDVRTWPKKKDGRRVVAITQYRDYTRKWTGEDLRDFINLSIYTGLRISDVVTFHIDRLNSEGEVRLRATKNGEWICVWIPEWLQAALRKRAQRIGPLVFGEHATRNVNIITEFWRRKLRKLWEQTGPWKDKPTPHRFRHTFVRILLEAGMSVAQIAVLVGDTEAMIRRHYSAWIPGHQKNITAALQEAFRSVPRAGS
jgi:integrase